MEWNVERNFVPLITSPIFFCPLNMELNGARQATEDT